MSLYVGKDSSGTAVLHLTKGATDLATIKSGVLSNTVFHSELPYATWTQVPCSPITIRNVNFIAISEADATALGNGKNIYFMTINNSIIQGIQVVNNFPTSVYNRKFGGWYSIYNYNGGFYQPMGYPTAENRYFLPYWGSNLANIALYKLNITNGVYQAVPKLNNEVLINPPVLSVRGVDLLTFKYLSPNVVNGVDRTISCYGSTFQLLNSSQPSSLSLVSNSTESSIYKDGSPLFSSLVNTKAQYYGYEVVGTYITSSRSFTLPADSIGSLVCLYIAARDTYGFYSGTHYLPVLLKIGSGNSIKVYNLVRYDDGASFGSFTITSTANTSTINLVLTGSAGAWDVSYTYFR